MKIPWRVRREKEVVHVHAGINRYKADLREIQFLLFEQFKLERASRQGALRGLGRGRSRRAVLTEAYRFAREVARAAQRASATQRAASSRTARSSRRRASRTRGRSSTRRAGSRSRARTEYGGQGAPAHAADARRGDALRREHRLQHVPRPHARRGRGHRAVRHARAEGAATASDMFNGTVGRHDVPDRAARRQRRRRGDDHGREATPTARYTHPRHQDLHLGRRSRSRREHHPPRPRARRRRARGHEGPHRSSSCPSCASTPTARSASATTSPSARIEHKMGINGSATCVLNFGENGKCIGGRSAATRSNQGMPQMFQHDERARASPSASRALRVASSAYLNALDYAKERKQGASITHWKDATAPRVPIIEHADVRRMLLDMKATVEGIRALAVKLAHATRTRRTCSRGQGRRRGRATTRARSTCSCRSSRPTAPTRASASARPRSRRYGGAGFTQRLPGRAVLPRREDLLASTRARTTSRRWTWSAASSVRQGGANLQAFLGDVGRSSWRQHADAPRCSGGR